MIPKTFSDQEIDRAIAFAERIIGLDEIDLRTKHEYISHVQRKVNRKDLVAIIRQLRRERPGRFSGYVAHRLFGDVYGAVQEMTFGKGRLVIGIVSPYMNYDAGYCYESVGQACAALEAWNGQDEPQGWFRCVTDGRRRPDGDPTREYIQP